MAKPFLFVNDYLGGDGMTNLGVRLSASCVVGGPPGLSDEGDSYEFGDGDSYGVNDQEALDGLWTLHPLSWPEIGEALRAVYATDFVKMMIAEKWEHKRRPGFTLDKGTIEIAAEHLVEEAREVKAEVDSGGGRVRIKSEMADVMGILIHLCVRLDMTLVDLLRLTEQQLRVNFKPRE